MSKKSTKTPAQKAAHERQKKHWARCKALAIHFEKMGAEGCPASSADINRWWKELRQATSEERLLSAAEGDTEALSSVVRVAREIFRREQAAREEMRRRAALEREEQIRERRALRQKREQEQERRPEKPTKAGAVKIMLWAIETIGSVEEARDAFERAASVLEE